MSDKVGTLKTNKTQCPDGRLSSPLKQGEGRQVLDLNTYIPNFLSSINNALTRGASKLYLAEFGVGIVEWRVMSILALEPNIPAVRICDTISTDKGQVSRALARLNKAELVEGEIVSLDVRKKKWWLTEAGLDLHDRILAIAIEREEKLIQGCDAQDIEAFLRVVRIMRANVDTL